MATSSAYLDRAREDLWSREVFTFIPDRGLPPPQDTTPPGAGPRVLFTGFPSDYSLAFLLALLALDVQPAGIVTSPGAHPAILGDNALSRVAEHLGIPLLRAWRINDEHSRMHLAQLDLDAVVMASFDQIVGRRALDIPRHGWMNIHPSLLPEFRGPEPVYWAIAEGAPATGVTMHRAVPKVDAGPILAQTRVPVKPDDTAGSLTRALVAAGVKVLPEAVEKLLSGAAGEPPDLSRSTYWPSVGHRLLNAAASAVEAERMVRAGVPNMLAWAHVGGEDVYVSAARVLQDGTAPAHRVLAWADGRLEIVASSQRCGCHHNESECPHRIAGVANV